MPRHKRMKLASPTPTALHTSSAHQDQGAALPPQPAKDPLITLEPYSKEEGGRDCTARSLNGHTEQAFETNEGMKAVRRQAQL